jgi:hypothetical protein
LSLVAFIIMVFKEDSPWSWPVPRFMVGRHENCKDVNATLAHEEDESDCERAFEIADILELGFARELVTDFMHPLRRSSRLWRFHVVRAHDRVQYRLFSDDGVFLMYAKAFAEARKVQFHLYNPSDRENSLYDPTRPAFTMTYNDATTHWNLVQEKCENCQFSPKHMSCSMCGKQQVAFLRHDRIAIGEGRFNCMEMHVPGLYSDESRVVWCPKLGRDSLARQSHLDTYESQMVVTKQPVWNDDVGSLVLDFKGRSVLSSAKNFQLALVQKPDYVICQYGKIGSNTFALDFRYPLSVIQAFGTAMSTMFWA